MSLNYMSMSKFELRKTILNEIKKLVVEYINVTQMIIPMYLSIIKHTLNLKL